MDRKWICVLHHAQTMDAKQQRLQTSEDQKIEMDEKTVHLYNEVWHNNCITWVPRQLTIMWVSSLAANMGKREHNTWDIIANAKPEPGEKEEVEPIRMINKTMIHLN